MLERLVSLFLPEDLLKYFDIINAKEHAVIDNKRGVLMIELDEKNILPLDVNPQDYESKGFYSPVKIQDFPIRGKEVYLVIRRRRWRHKLNKTEIKNDYSFVAEGSKITKELSDFLKGTHRIQRGYH